MNRYSLSLLLIILLAACSKHTTNPSSGNTQLSMLQYVAQDTSFSLYNFALQRTGMTTDSTFLSDGPYTIFAPQDTAFINAGLTQNVLATMDVNRLRSILQCQVVKGRISSQDLTGYYSEPVLTLDTAYQPNITKNYYGLFLDGIPTIKTDELGDGVIQETGRLVAPPTNDLMHEIDSLPELSFLAAALHHNALLRNALETPNPHAINYSLDDTVYGITLLAPTNNAFIAYGFPDTIAVQNADSALIANLLGGYLRLGIFFSSQFKGGVVFNGNIPPYLYQQFEGGGVYWLTTDGVTFQSTANVLHTAHIIKADIVATNGVMDELDYFVFPSLQTL